MKISKSQLRQIIREEYTRLKIRRMLNEGKGDLVKDGLSMTHAKQKDNNKDGVLFIVETSLGAQLYLFPRLRGLKGVEQFNKVKGDEEISCVTFKNGDDVKTAIVNARNNPDDKGLRKKMFETLQKNRLASSTNKIKKSDIDDQYGADFLFLPAEYAKSLFK